MIKSNSTIPHRLRIVRCEEDSFFFFESPKRSAINEVVPRGHTFRQTPVPTTNNTGATGIRMFHKSVTPKGGMNSINSSRAIPINQNTICTVFQKIRAREAVFFIKEFSQITVKTDKRTLIVISQVIDLGHHR